MHKPPEGSGSYLSLLARSCNCKFSGTAKLLGSGSNVLHPEVPLFRSCCPFWALNPSSLNFTPRISQLHLAKANDAKKHHNPHNLLTQSHAKLNGTVPKSSKI